MKILIIDTTSNVANICLTTENKNYVSIIPSTKKHSESLLTEIEKILDSANVKLKDLNYFGAVTGPGSFTGIRIGISTIKAFNFALNKQIVADNVFNVVKNKIKNGIMLIKNTSNSCYYSEIVNSKIKSSGIYDFNEIKDIKNKEFYSINEQLTELNSYININYILDYSNLLIEHFVNLAKHKKIVSANDFSPYYMQLSQAERELESKTND